MTQDDILDAAIKAIFWRVFQIQPEEITDQTSWDDLEQWDSLGHLELLEALREAFHIDIPPEQAVEMRAVGDIKRMVSSLQAHTGKTAGEPGV
jgi:acyl carrier protein